MRCRFQKSIFQNKENGFCIFIYHTDDGNVPQAARSKYYKGEGTEFTAVGNHLPDTSATDVELQLIGTAVCIHGYHLLKFYPTRLKLG